ncbi:MAG: methionyl-tRNA formyltransferase, partial [candidate division NC10 bacterium]|nr:methionyl-tRNA formyltransferase [candidate division NC10 bacterium]
CYNVHPSLLPKFRGPAPINWALIAGEEETGVTIIRMDEGMDTGPILLQKVTPTLPEDTAGSLEGRLASLGAEALAEALWLVEKHEARLVPQEDRFATYAPKLKEEDGRLQWSWEAKRLHNLIRGLSPEPGAYTFLKGKRLKVLRSAMVSEGEEGGLPGTILTIEKEGLVVATGRGALRLLEVQPDGRRRMTAAEFARGARLQQGETFHGG